MHVDRDLLLTGHPETMLMKSNHAKSKIWCKIPSFTYLIDHPDGKMLFDASISQRWQQEWLPEWQELAPWEHTEEELFENALKGHKLGPEDIDYLFLSHLHTDHAGNARLFKTSGAKILVHDDEFTAAANRKVDEHFFLNLDYDIPGAKYNLLPGDVEIMKDVFAVSLPGHTPGTMGLMVHLDRSGTIILTSDACYMKESYDSEVGSIISADLVRWGQSMRKLKMLARCHQATIIPGHDHNICHEGEASLAAEKTVRVGRAYE
jgi:glyoxylase-like metal-dependent hydrolase (beta-lactamase superfamily II)